MTRSRTKVLIITRSFVREVSALVKYVERFELPFQFALVMPHYSEPLPAVVSLRKPYFYHHLRATCYPPSLMADIQAFHPDILHVFEEFSGLIAFQAILFKNLLFQKSKVMVYSAENIFGNVRPILRLPMRYVMRYSDLAFVCSQSVKQVLEQEGYRKPIEVFPLGVDSTEFYKFSCHQVKSTLDLNGKFVLGYVGRLLLMKGVDCLVEMMRSLPEHVHLLIIGTGPQEQELRRKISEYHLTHRIHMLGDIPYSQLPQYINCMDIGILPSRTTPRWKEQFGRVLVEFMSCQIPVIGSDSGSIPEILDDVGMIFHEDNIQELVDLVMHLMNDPEKRTTLGERGYEKVQALYSIDVMGKRLTTMYQQLLTS